MTRLKLLGYSWPVTVAATLMTTGVACAPDSGADIQVLPADAPIRRGVIDAVFELPDPLGLGEVGGIVAVDSAVVVVDRDSKSLHVFRNTGSDVRTLQREGEGPGEWRMPCCVVHDRFENTLWLRDSGAGRFTEFRVDDALNLVYVSSIASRYATEFMPLAMAALGDETLRAVRATFTRKGELRLQVATIDGQRNGHEFEVPNRSGAATSRIERSRRSGSGLRGYSVQIPYAPTQDVALSTNGAIAVINTGVAQVRWLDDSGRVFRIQELSASEPRPLTLAERGFAEQVVRELGHELGDNLSRSASIPTSAPILRAAYFDAKDRLWVEQFDARNGFTRADILSDSGLVAVAEWPESVDLKSGFIGDSVAYGVLTGLDGRKTIARLLFH